MSSVSAQPWTPSHTRYAETIAIRIAIDVLGTGPTCRTHRCRYVASTDKKCIAARRLGAHGANRAQLLVDLVAITRLHGVRPIPTIRRAVDALQPA